MSDITFEILKATVIVAIILITRYCIPALESYISNSKYAWVSSVVKDAVESAEQTIKEEKSGSKKKAMVQTTVAQIFASAGITITQDQLNDLIESAVFAMNRDKKKAIQETNRDK